MRMTINEIILNELNAEIDSIIEYRMGVASGIIDYEYQVLTDTELTNAFEKVISHYKNKIGIPYYHPDMPYYQPDMFSYANDVSIESDISFGGVDFAELTGGSINFEDTTEHTKEYYDTERNR
jgi:hypothetical protein